MTTSTPLDRKRAFRLAAALVGLAATLSACTHTGDVATTASIPDDSRKRHPRVEDATGTITADVPAGTPNARAAADSFREIQALLSAAGVPPRGLVVRNFHPQDPRQMAAIRLSYPKLAAVAGPCGMWPEDLGPSIKNKSYFENKQYYNFGCASQRNMAAMIDNPADLVQPRPETPAYTIRRSEAFEKYRKGTPTTTSYPEADKAKLSDTGK